jgi:IS4 transposase
VNVARGVLFNLNILRGKSIKDDNIKLYKSGTCMAMQKKVWIIAFLFKEFLSFLKRSIPGGVSFIN